MSIAILALGVPLFILGSLLIFFLLRALHRRLNLFTRGTIAFMTVVLVIFTVGNLITLAQEVKFKDARLRQEAIRNVVGQTAHRVFDASALVTSDDSEGAEIEREFLRVRKQVLEALEEDADCCDASDFRLVAYRVEQRGHYAHLAPRHVSQRWQVHAVLIDPDRSYRHGRQRVYKRPVHCVLTVSTLLDENGTPRVTAVEGGTAADNNVASQPKSVWANYTWRDPDLNWVSGVGLQRKSKS